MVFVLIVGQMNKQIVTIIKKVKIIMAIEVTLDGKVYRDGDELMILTKEERKGLDGYIDLLLAGREITKILQHR